MDTCSIFLISMVGVLSVNKEENLIRPLSHSSEHRHYLFGLRDLQVWPKPVCSVCLHTEQ
jgi:hypothetical protein